ncbi:MAG: hypothetical protein JWP63_1905 [Candidatus Solibacter sp.]|nr:hypothetical protein [Candidatus Solibacter sp.]
MLILRQRLVFMMLGGAKKHPPKSKTAFQRCALGLFDGIAAPELAAELKRIGAQRGGISRLIAEAWNELEADRCEEETICKYWETIQRPKHVHVAERKSSVPAKAE